jgi:predicted Zn-dependent peptidase
MSAGRRLLFVRLSLLLGLCLAALASPGESMAFQGADLHRFALENGLQVWHLPRHDSPSVAIFLVVRAGGRYENEQNNGVSHFLEHFLFTETERWKEGEVFQVMNRLGGVNNATTESERTTWYNIAAPEYFEPAMDWMAEVVLHSKMAPEHIEKERQIIFRENGGPDSWFVEWCNAIGYGGPTQEELYTRLFPASTLSLPIIGKNHTLDAMDHDTLTRYYKTHYLPNNALLLVVGNIESGLVEDAARRYFGAWERGTEVPWPTTPPLPEQGPIRITQRGMDLQDEGAVWMGVRTDGVLNPDRWTFEVLGHVLEERLFQKLRIQEGLVYSVGASQQLFSDVGDFRIAARARREHLPRVEQAITAEIDAIKAGDVDDNEVADAQKTIIGRHALAMESNYAHAFALIEFTHLPGAGAALIPDFDGSINAVTAADLKRVAATSFTPERSYVIVYDPICTANELAIFAVASTALAIGLYVWRYRRYKQQRATEGEQGWP